MIERTYAMNETHAQQTLSIIINAPPKNVFRYLSTTEGISSWFPELSFNEKNEVLFDMDDGHFERMKILTFEPDQTISYEWGTGKVAFHLLEYDGKTKLTFHEVVPRTFEMFSRDFAGWDTKMKDIKDIVETGAVEEMDRALFEQRKESIEQELRLNEKGT